MSAQLKRWIPIALCCVPGIAIAVIVGIGIAFGGTAISASPLGSGSLGLGVIVLAMLACPISMMLMMRRGMRQNASGHSSILADCCAPGEQASPESARLTALRTQREALERELAEMQAR